MLTTVCNFFSCDDCSTGVQIVYLLRLQHTRFLPEEETPAVLVLSNPTSCSASTRCPPAPAVLQHPQYLSSPAPAVLQHPLYSKPYLLRLLLQHPLPRPLHAQKQHPQHVLVRNAVQLGLDEQLLDLVRVLLGGVLRMLPSVRAGGVEVIRQHEGYFCFEGKPILVLAAMSRLRHQPVHGRVPENQVQTRLETHGVGAGMENAAPGAGFAGDRNVTLPVRRPPLGTGMLRSQCGVLHVLVS